MSDYRDAIIWLGRALYSAGRLAIVNLHLILAAVVAFLFLFIALSAIDQSSKFEAILSLFAASVPLCLIGWVLKGRANLGRLRERLDQLATTLEKEPSRIIRAQELLTCAELHSSRASFNSIASIGVLILLALFVAFAGAALNLDAVKLGTLAQTTTSLRDSREFFDNNKTNMTDDARQRALANIANKETEETKLTQDQAAAEAKIFDPTNRIFSALLIRIAVVAVSIYLVIILNRAYKQNTAMSALYRSRLVALLRDDSDLEAFAKYAVLVSAETVEYKTDIDTPVEQLVNAVKKVTEAFRKG